MDSTRLVVRTNCSPSQYLHPISYPRGLLRRFYDHLFYLVKKPDGTQIPENLLDMNIKLALELGLL